MVIRIPPPPPVVLAVAVKVTGEPSRPLALAVVVCSPGSGPSTRTTEVRPSEPVSVVAAETLPAPWAAQLTLTPSTGTPDSLVTSTTSGFGQRLADDSDLPVAACALDL